MKKMIFCLIIATLANTSLIAATARPSIIANAGARMPTMTNRINFATNATVTTSTPEKIVDACMHKKSEKLTASRCFARYEACLRQENVCGADFELCTDISAKHKDFMGIKIMCDEVLELCSADAINALYKPATNVTELAATQTMCDGEYVVTGYNFNQSIAALVPQPKSRLAQMIEGGASLAALNSVSTCYKVAEQCFTRTCAKNPYNCVVGSDKAAAGMYVTTDTDGTESKAPCTRQDVIDGKEGCVWGEYVDATGVRNYLRAQCYDAIGGNKFCHMTVNGKMPQQADLVDEIEKGLVFSDIYNSKFLDANNMKQKLDEMIDAARRGARDACAKTIEDCAMRSCGGGNGAVCYVHAQGTDGAADGGIGDTISTDDIAGGFCRVKVIAKSDSDDYGGGKILGTAYFAAGDSILCGSWLDTEDCDVGNNGGVCLSALAGAAPTGNRTSQQKWTAAGIGLLGMLGGGALTRYVVSEAGAYVDDGNGGFRAWKTGDTVTRYDRVSRSMPSSNLGINKVSINENAITITQVESGGLTFAQCNAEIERLQNNDKRCSSESTKSGLFDMKGGKVFGTVAGAGLLGAGAWIATIQAQKAANENEKEEWYKKARENISCYIGSQRVAKYNEVLSVEF